MESPWRRKWEKLLPEKKGRGSHIRKGGRRKGTQRHREPERNGKRAEGSAGLENLQ